MRARTRTVLFDIAVFLIGAAMIAFALLCAGCAIGRTMDGDDPMIGFRLDSAGEVMKGALGTIGGALFGPPGAAIGTALGGLWIGHHRGSRKGWEEKEEDLKKNGKG